jgi:hypothetical protein
MWMRPRRRRASMYLAVLMTAMIVAIIGLSALAATRVQSRAAESGNDIAAARFAAQSAIEMGMLTLNNTPTWRTTYTHDVWIPERGLGDGTYTWKLVDERNLSLTKDTTAPVRLCGRGVVGDAVRTESVLLQTGFPDPTNLLGNPGFERGVKDWTDPSDCDLALDTATPHGGLASLWVKNRADDYAGPLQEITDDITEGVTYEVAVWVKMRSFSENAWLSVRYRTEYGWSTDYFAVQSVGTGWALVTGEFTTSWPGTLQTAYWKIETYWSSQDFMIDDVVVRKAGAVPPAALPIVGTWRREVN